MDILNTKINNILTEKTLKVRPENIKSGVNILGINGSVVELNGETKTVTPTTSSQTIVPTGTGKNALTQVTVNGVTSAIDNNITAGNIKKDVTILGITGTYEGEGGSFPPDWSEIGYEDTPASIIEAFNYAKEIQEDWDSSITSMNNKYLSDIKLQVFPLVDTSNVTTMQSAFNGSNLGAIPLLNTSNVTNMSSTFRACKLFADLPQLNTSKVETFQYCFAQCESLVDVPVLDTSSVTGYGFQLVFGSCPNLSNDSLNNILLMCINTRNVYGNYRKLSEVGLTSAQATICQGLSNYQAFLNAGWTTGY